MAEQDFLNYASDDGGNVSVPRRLRTRPDSSEVELAYITPEEAGILSTLRPGSPHRGPMEVPSYDDYDVSTGTYRSGAAMSAAESSGPQNERMRADLRQAGISPQEARAIRSGAAAAAAQGQGGGGNFFGNIGVGIRNIGGGIRNIGNKLGAWAGKMRGRINPATNTWYTQDEYEQNVQNRRDRATMDRLGRTREKLYANDPRGWEASDLSGRLEGLEKQFEIDQPVDARGLFEQKQIDAAPINNRRDVYDFDDVTFNERIPPDTAEILTRSGMRNMEIANNPNLQYTSDMVRPVGTRFEGNLQDYQRGLVQNVGLNKDQTDYLDIIAKKGVIPESKRFYTYDEPQTLKENIMRMNPSSESLGWTGYGFDPDKIVSGDKKTYATDEDVNQYMLNKYGLEPENEGGRRLKMNLPVIQGIAQGGRVGYNKGGRVGILSVF